MMMTDEIKIRPREVKGRKIFMTMYSDIDWTQKNNEDICRQNASRVSAYVRSCPAGSRTFLGHGDEEKWNGTLSYKPDGEWNFAAVTMMLECTESGLPVFRCTSPVSRGTFKSFGGGKSSIQYNAASNRGVTVGSNHCRQHIPPEFASRLTKHKTLDA